MDSTNDLQNAINSYKQKDLNQQQFNGENDELSIGYEIIPLPSKGDFYSSKKDSIKVEYLTTKDEDILTTPSLIENNTVLDIILKKKILDKDIKIEELLPGDRDAILLFLRMSAYGKTYNVEVTDPRNGIIFPEVVDLTKLKHKVIVDKPDNNGCFDVFLDVRQKNVKFRLLTDVQEREIRRNADNFQKAYNAEYNEYSSLKLKSQIVSVNGNSDRGYINKFVDSLPPLDGRQLRRKILDVTPGLDMKYEFTTKDGYKFFAFLNVGIDFFFPSL